MVKQPLIVAFMMLSTIFASCDYEKPEYYRYTVDAHYLNGEVRRIILYGYCEPYIYSYKGSYDLCTDRNEVKGVLFFDLIKKEKWNED